MAAWDLPHGEQDPNRFGVGAIQHGYRMERLRCDKGEDNIIYEYGKACFNLGISEELAAVATSQKIGVSEWDGRNLTAIARSLLKDGGFNKSL